MGRARNDADEALTVENLRILAESTGGTFLRFARKNDISRLFAQVRERAARACCRTSRRGRSHEPRCELSVAVPGGNVAVRAPGGYYPR